VIDQANLDATGKIIEFSQRLGGLSAAAFFALYSVGTTYLLWQKQKDDKELTTRGLEAREASIRAEEHQTEALLKVAQQAAMNTALLAEHTKLIEKMLILIQERIPQRP